MPDRGKGCREVAREVGRAPSTVADEAERRRLATSPRALRGEPAPALAGLRLVRAALGPDGMRRVFRLALTDDGPEFADEGGIAAPLGELLGPAGLDPTPGCVERARADGGEAPLAE